ncbi:hypothetical protein [Glycomyces sp. NPDC048151]|uniref:hypothetical protein n=1 Tax=Glycomyces sp. NPDC048151 TaxID=3364002 RepID=UPI0037183AD2
MKRNDLRRYTAVLTNLIERRTPPRHAIRALRREAEKIGGVPQVPVAVLTRDHVHGALGACLAGELDAVEVCAWSDVVVEHLSYLNTGGKALAAEIGYQSAIYNALRHLSDRQAADLDVEALGRASALLDYADLDPNREWTDEETARGMAMIDLVQPGMQEQAQQGLELAHLEADIRGLHDAEPIPLMLSRGIPQPGQYRARPLGEGEFDLVGFELAGCTWMIRPGKALGFAELARVSRGRDRLAAHILHESGEFQSLIPAEDAEPVPEAVASALAQILADARASGLRL